MFFRFGKHRKTVDVIPGLDQRIIMAHENTTIPEQEVISSTPSGPDHKSSSSQGETGSTHSSLGEQTQQSLTSSNELRSSHSSQSSQQNQAGNLHGHYRQLPPYPHISRPTQVRL